MPASKICAIAVKIDQGTRDRINRLAESRDRTSDSILKEAINQYLEREEKKEAFRQGALGVWSEYKASGLHVTADEAILWIETWGDEAELPAPECHK
ncbi:MAG: CopG family transcriptional regulator [Pseudomonadota bacterium]